MNKLLLIAALAGSTAAAANAASWVAVCNDGKNVQYIQTVGGVGFLYLKTDKEFYQTARLSQISFDGETLCGAVHDNAATGAEPVTQVCINKAHQEITLKYKDPTVKGGALQDVGAFCPATVTIRATNLKVD